MPPPTRRTSLPLVQPGVISYTSCKLPGQLLPGYAGGKGWVALYQIGQFKAMALKQEEPRRSIPQVITILERNGDVAVGTLERSTLWRQLAQKGLGGRQPLPEKPLRRFEADLPGRLYQGDVKYGPHLPDPQDPQRKRRTYLVGFLDDHSRLLTHAEFFWAEDVYALELCFQKALLRRGAPAAVYVDQGLIFPSQLFSYACAELGIQHISATAYHPQGKGKIEKYWRYVDEAFLLELRHDPVSTLAELNRRFWAWVEGRPSATWTATTATKRYWWGCGTIEKLSRRHMRLWMRGI